LDWLERYRGLLGDQAYLAARATFGSRMYRQVGSLRMIARGCLSGAVSPARSAYYLAAWAFPPVRTLGVQAKQALLSYRPIWPR
jgi:hypothetical protein